MPNEHDFIQVFTAHRPTLLEKGCLAFIKEMDELVSQFKAGLPTPDEPVYKWEGKWYKKMHHYGCDGCAFENMPVEYCKKMSRDGGPDCASHNIFVEVLSLSLPSSPEITQKLADLTEQADKANESNEITINGYRARLEENCIVIIHGQYIFAKFNKADQATWDTVKAMLSMLP